ncbi:MAG: MFS transporter [Acidobacteria bacterium]|nr:MFS transporter [Acidobacteriota bacterium]
MKTTRAQCGWYFYDWANSAFYTSVVTVFFGPWLTVVTKAAADAEGYVYPLGLPVRAGAYFPYLVALSIAVQVLVLPVVGAIADQTQRKRELLSVTAYVGAIATIAMYYVQGAHYLAGGALFVLAMLAYHPSIVFYNAFLPEIAAPDERDRVSSIGWAIGYLGGGVLLALNLLLVTQAESWGMTTEKAIRISLASAGVWWAVFTLIPLATLRNRPSTQNETSHLIVGFQRLRGTFARLRTTPHTLRFLLAYLLFNDGVQTVITLSAQFGQEELGLSIATLTQVILLVQFVAFGGSLLFNAIAKAVGAKRAVMWSLLIWMTALFYLYGFLHTSRQFFGLGVVIALVLGGTQALSRSLFTQMIPAGHEAEYFSFYEITDKGASWLGPLLFGLAYQFTGQYRLDILSLLVLFASGLWLLSRVNLELARTEAAR